MGERVSERKYTVIEHNASTMITSASRNYSQRNGNALDQHYNWLNNAEFNGPSFELLIHFLRWQEYQAPKDITQCICVSATATTTAAAKNRKIPLYDEHIWLIAPLF